MKLPVDYTNLTIDEKKYVREEYIKQQNGLCMYCKSPLTEDPPKWIMEKKITPRLYPKGFFQHPIHLQHCHVTGMTEGAVHNYCNAVLWEYEHR